MDDQRLEELLNEAKELEQEFQDKLKRLSKLAEVCSAGLVDAPIIKSKWFKSFPVCPNCGTSIVWLKAREKRAMQYYKHAHCTECDWEYATIETVRVVRFPG